MKEKWELFKVSLTEDKIMTKKEWLLTIAVFALAGIVLGMLLSPRKNVTIGSNNGNNNGSNNQDNNNNNSGSVSTEAEDVPELIGKHCKKTENK